MVHASSTILLKSYKFSESIKTVDIFPLDYSGQFE